MCRWIAYRGETTALEHYVTTPAHLAISAAPQRLRRRGTRGKGALPTPQQAAGPPSAVNPLRRALAAEPPGLRFGGFRFFVSPPEEE